MKRCILSTSLIGIFSAVFSGTVHSQSGVDFLVCKPNNAKIDDKQVECDPNKYSEQIGHNYRDGSDFWPPERNVACMAMRFAKDDMQASAGEYSRTVDRQLDSGGVTVRNTISVSRIDGTFSAEYRAIDNDDGELLRSARFTGSCKLETLEQKY